MRALSLVVVDHTTDTADVLSAIYQPQGVAVRRLTPRRDQSHPGTKTRVLVMDDDEASLVCEARTTSSRWKLIAADDDVRSVTLPPLFRYGELISAIDRILQDAA